MEWNSPSIHGCNVQSFKESKNRRKRSKGIDSSVIRKSVRIQQHNLSRTAGADISEISKITLKSKHNPRQEQSQDGRLPPAKRRRLSAIEQTSPSVIQNNDCNPIPRWVSTGKWQGNYCDQAGEVWHRSIKDSPLSRGMNPLILYHEINGKKYPRPIKRAASSLARKSSASSLNSLSDQRNRDTKSTIYRSPKYSDDLAAKGSYMKSSSSGISEASKRLCLCLLESRQEVPRTSLFQDDIFEESLRRIDNRNEARIIRDISPLMVPSAETLAIHGATNLDHLLEGLNEGWTNAIPVCGTRPQPDYFVGFGRSAFTEAQFDKLQPLLGCSDETSLFAVTNRIYFVFFTCEVKSGGAGLDIADRQNAHSMTIASRAIVEIFRAVQREQELHREIVGFSASHNHRSIRFYAHYAIIDGQRATFYREAIAAFDITNYFGRDKWLPYQFTMSIYNIWLPTHVQKLRSAIDDLPDNIDFTISPLASFSQTSNQDSQYSRTRGTSTPAAEAIAEGIAEEKELTPASSITHATMPKTVQTISSVQKTGRITKKSKK